MGLLAAKDFEQALTFFWDIEKGAAVGLLACLVGTHAHGFDAAEPQVTQHAFYVERLEMGRQLVCSGAKLRVDQVGERCQIAIDIDVAEELTAELQP